MKVCPICGTKLSGSASYCAYCGNSVEVAETEDYREAYKNMKGFDPVAYQQFQQAQARGVEPTPQPVPQPAPQPTPVAYQQAPVQAAQPVQPQPVPGYQQPVPQAPQMPVQGYQQPPYQQPYGYQQPYNAYYQQDSGTNTAIKVFLILSCVASAYLLFIPLLWAVPMTVIIWKKLDRNEYIGTGLKVCTLLFVNLIAGILLLTRKEPMQPQPPYYY